MLSTKWKQVLKEHCLFLHFHKLKWRKKSPTHCLFIDKSYLFYTTFTCIGCVNVVMPWGTWLMSHMLHSSSHLLSVERFVWAALAPLGIRGWGCISRCPIICISVGDDKVNKCSLHLEQEALERKDLSSFWSFSHSFWTATRVGTSSQSSPTCKLKNPYTWDRQLSPHNYGGV